MKAIALFVAIALSSKFDQILVDSTELERDARALELYLQDRDDHKNHCPEIEWDQPPLSTYKEQLRSHLPRGCKS